jgi:hypothetical protein
MANTSSLLPGLHGFFDHLFSGDPGQLTHTPYIPSGDTMADSTRDDQLLDAKLGKVAAETDTKIARMEGKLDLVLSKIDGLGTRFEDARADAKEARTTARADNAATRANIWVVGLGLAVLIVAVAALFPVFFSIGAQVRDLVHSEMQAQPQQSPQITPSTHQ